MAEERPIVRAIALIGEGRSMLESLREKMQNEFDEKSEKWQEGDKGQEMQTEIELLEDVTGRLEDIETEVGDLKSAKE